MAARQELEVQAVWHQQVHQSRVGALALSPGAGSLWSGCDAAAPRPGPAEGIEEPPVVLVSCKDGSTLRRVSGLPPCNVRLLHALPQDEGALLCITGDGGFVTLGTEGEGDVVVRSSTALPGMPTAARIAEEAAGRQACQQHGEAHGQEGKAAPAQEQATAAAAAEGSPAAPADAGKHERDAEEGSAAADTSTDPEFIAEAGYRGHREGYLFREGFLGPGYYHKDVVRRYCASAAAVPLSTAATSPAPDSTTSPATAAAEAVVPGGDASSSGEVEARQQQQGDAQAEQQPQPQPQQQQQQGQQAQQGEPGEQRGSLAPAPPQPCSEGEEARRYIQRLLRAPPSMHSVAYSPCGVLLYTGSLGSKDCSIRVWGLLPCGAGGGSSSGSGSTATSSGSHSNGGTSSAMSGTSSAAAAAAAAAAAGALVQPELHRTLTGHTAPVLSLAVSPDGRLLLSGSYDHTIRVWNTADWHCVRVLKGHGGGVRALAVAPDGATLYSAAADNTVRTWSMQHWVCLRTMHGRHDDATWPACLALSPDGALLASGSTGPFGGSTIKVFQTGSGGGHEAGACLASFAQLHYDQRASMTALLFSPDSSTLYSGTSDGTLAAWRLSWRAVSTGSGRAGGGLRRGFL